MTQPPDPILAKVHELIGYIDSLQGELRRESHNGCACGNGGCCAKHAHTFNLLDNAHRLLDRAADDLRLP